MRYNPQHAHHSRKRYDTEDRVGTFQRFPDCLRLNIQRAQSKKQNTENQQDDPQVFRSVQTLTEDPDRADNQNNVTGCHETGYQRWAYIILGKYEGDAAAAVFQNKSRDPQRIPDQGANEVFLTVFFRDFINDFLLKKKANVDQDAA